MLVSGSLHLLLLGSTAKLHANAQESRRESRSSYGVSPTPRLGITRRLVLALTNVPDQQYYKRTTNAARIVDATAAGLVYKKDKLRGLFRRWLALTAEGWKFGILLQRSALSSNVGDD